MARKRKRIGGAGASIVMPNLNSLMDVITIILVYLIKSMVSSPIEVKDPSVNLPISTSLEHIEDSIVVMITGAERRETVPGGKVMTVPAVPTIVVDDDVLMQLGADFSIPADQLERELIIRPLKQRLLEVRKQQGVTAELTDSAGFSGKIVFVVDKNVPFRTLSRALVSSAQAGYDGFKFAIVKQEG